MLNFTESEKNSLINLLDEYKKTKAKSLWPIFDEINSSLEKGVLVDAYQARYLRDAFSSSEDNKIKYADFDKLLEEKYFS